MSAATALAGSAPAERDTRGATSPAAWVPTLYFAEGLPATVIGAMSAIFLKELGVSNAGIAMCVSAFMLPWLVRPLWSPWLELYGTKRLFVVVTELLMAAGLAAVAIAIAMGGTHRISVCVALLTLFAFVTATHDMAADGFFIRSLSPELQQRYVGWLGVAFNAGRLAVQGLLVVVVGQLALRWGAMAAWQAGFAALAVVAALLAVHHARALPLEPRALAPQDAPPGMVHGLRDILVSFFTKAGAAWLLGLIVVYRLAEGYVTRMAPLFLLDPRERGGLGLTTAQVGLWYGGLGGAAFVTGAVVGGWMAGRLGRRRAMIPFCLAFNLPALVYLALAANQPSLPMIALAIATEQFAYGLGSIGLKLATFSAAEGPYETAHCAFAGALSGAGAMVSGMASGALQGTLGYGGFFALAVLAAAPTLFVAAVNARPARELAPAT